MSFFTSSLAHMIVALRSAFLIFLQQADVADLLSLLVNWGACKGCPADFDGNDTVGVSDLLILLANWGPCP